ncbi:MAG: DNA cytosine methyltransferase [Bdellovibrionaceae bacterium]|nr:DNA cytosine methyltransferase [Pseudobdellovibrionaceae bacterium]
MNQRGNRNRDHYFLDLFAGSGGFTLGLESAGFTSLGSVEINPVTRRTLEENFGETPLQAVRAADGDVTRVDLKKLKAELSARGISNLDLLVACPPCQGFSRVGRAKLDSLAGSKGSHSLDPRNRLYRKVIDFLTELKPKVFLFENVPGMLSIGGRNVAEIVCRQVQEAGYNVRATVLNAAWFGVPQLRERVIIMAFRNDLAIEPEFPMIRFDGPETEGHMTGGDSAAQLWRDDEFFVPCSRLKRAAATRPFRCVQDALGDLPGFTAHLKALSKGRKYKALRGLHEEPCYVRGRISEYAQMMRRWPGYEADDIVRDHFCRWTPRDFRIFRRMKEGDKYPDAIGIAEGLYRSAREAGQKVRRDDFIPPYRVDSFKEKWRKLIRSRPSWTLTAHLSKDSYSHIHYDSKQARSITPREAARLQSFPDGFRFHGCMGDVFVQVGNAVPPLFSKAIGETVLTLLTGRTRKKVRYSGRGEEARP